MSEILKNCPFCGGISNKEDKSLNRIYFDSENGYTFVYCEECGCRTSFVGTQKGAAKVWNKRAYEKP